MTPDEIAKKHGVASLELSKALAKAGMPQKSLWYWYEHYNDIKEQNEYFLSRLNPDLIHSIRYSAFNATELADVLPPFCLGGKTSDGGFNCWKFDDMCHRNIEHYNSFQTDTLSNALGKMVLHLLEKGIIKKDDL